MTSQEKDWAMACHLASFAGWIVPLGWVLGPLIVWLIKRNEYPLVDEQGKESLNFQISLLIYAIVAGLLCLIVIGFFLLFALAVFQIVLIIIATVRVSNGEHYRGEGAGDTGDEWFIVAYLVYAFYKAMTLHDDDCCLVAT